MKFTGERMIPECNSSDKIYLEHINRYHFAKQFVEGKDVLDIACGSGYGSDLLKNAGAKSVLGVDISKETIDFCKNKYPDGEFLVGSVDDIPVGDKSIDVIVSFETIEHVNDEAQEKFMREVGRVLRDGGVLVLSTPNALVYEKGNAFHIKELNPEELSTLLRKNGFEHDLYFQESVDANYIFSSDEIESGLAGKDKDFIFENQAQCSAWEARYLIVVCAKKITEKKAISSVYVSNIRSIRHTTANISITDDLIAVKDAEISLKNQEIELKKLEIDSMKRSKFWKIRNSYLKTKGIFSK